MSTLAPIELHRLDNSVPPQATTPTNRIQQEIVKQLLYREDPSKTPSSRFRRIERFRWKREIVISLFLGFVVAIIFLLMGWTEKITTTFSDMHISSNWAQLIIWSVASGVVFLGRWLFYGKIHIKQLSAGAATVTLNDNSMSYFDQYLDEIFYFFEMSGRDIVLFEDIDRFNDSHIFETLRALNTLLNASPQIKKKPIRFIYAIKDSIFDRVGLEMEGRKSELDVLAIIDPAQAETERANRTKFFDLIIPVVPFVTHRSARNLAIQLVGEYEHEVNLELFDIAAQYVPDMRLLKNVRNEFTIFRERIFSGDGKSLNLSETDLFAMMLYKSTHLRDFETIRLGTSNLDILYRVNRELVTENIKRIEDERRKLRNQLDQIDGADKRSIQLGNSLIEYMQRLVEAANGRWQNASFEFNRKQQSVDDLKRTIFWKGFTDAKTENAVLQLFFTSSNYRHSFSFSRKNLSIELCDPLDSDSWNKIDHEELSDKINKKTEEINFLRGADLGALVERPEFLVEYEGSRQPFESIAKSILKSGLAFLLVTSGYINRNFTLYTSTFHGNRVGPAATNFIIHHVERDLMDEYFELTIDGVDAIIRERGEGALKESAMYNIAILDCLLGTKKGRRQVLRGYFLRPKFSTGPRD